MVLVREAVKENVVSELKSNRRLLRVGSAQGTLEEVEGHLRVGDLPPGVYSVSYTHLTLPTNREV